MKNVCKCSTVNLALVFVVQISLEGNSLNCYDTTRTINALRPEKKEMDEGIQVLHGLASEFKAT